MCAEVGSRAARLLAFDVVEPVVERRYEEALGASRAFADTHLASARSPIAA
jgi:hypothetical protein